MTAETSSRDAAPGTLRRGPAAAGAGEAVRGSRRARRATARKGASEAAAPQREQAVERCGEHFANAYVMFFSAEGNSITG